MVYLIARDTYNIHVSPRKGDDRRSHPGTLRDRYAKTLQSAPPRRAPHLALVSPSLVPREKSTCDRVQVITEGGRVQPRLALDDHQHGSRSEQRGEPTRPFRWPDSVVRLCRARRCWLLSDPTRLAPRRPRPARRLLPRVPWRWRAVRSGVTRSPRTCLGCAVCDRPLGLLDGRRLVLRLTRARAGSRISSALTSPRQVSSA